MRVIVLGLIVTTVLWSTTTYTVTVPGDTNVAEGGVFSSNMGDLRGCINTQNFQVVADDYVIDFDPSIGTIYLNGILPVLGFLDFYATSTVTIDGSGYRSNSLIGKVGWEF